MTWNDITISQWERMQGKDPEEMMYILAENMTIAEFNNTDWSFLQTKPKQGLLKEFYIIDGEKRIPNVDPRSWSVQQYVQFTNGNLNNKLNVIFNTEDVNYDNMSLIDFEEVMFFFIKIWKNCSKVFQKYIHKMKDHQMLEQQFKILESLVFLGR